MTKKPTAAPRQPANQNTVAGVVASLGGPVNQDYDPQHHTKAEYIAAHAKAVSTIRAAIAPFANDRRKYFEAVASATRPAVQKGFGNVSLQIQDFMSTDEFNTLDTQMLEGSGPWA